MNNLALERKLIGPTAASRQRALEVKRGNREGRIAKLTALLDSLAKRVEDGTLKRQDIQHQLIIAEAAISQATYWRYFGQSEEIRARVQKLLGQPDDPIEESCASSAVETTELTLAAQLARANEEIKRSKATCENLQRQISVCKALIDMMELDFRAKQKEVDSKDFDLSVERKRNLDLLVEIQELRTTPPRQDPNESM